MAYSANHNNAVSGTRVLVTGGGGFIGSHIVEHLITHGACVAVLSRTEGQLAELDVRDGYKFLPCDITETESTIAAIQAFAPQIVYHFAALPDATESHAHIQKAIQTNTIGTLNVLEGLRRGGGGLFIYGDSCKCYGDSDVPYRESLSVRPLSSYAIGKVAGWELCEMYGRLYSIDVVSIRPTLIYGPRQGRNLISFVVDSILKGKRAIVLDGGSQTRDPLFVDDAVDALLAVAGKASEASGRVINIGGGREYTVAELASAVAEAMGVSVSIVSAPERMRSTEMLRSYCDNSEVRNLLGWEPKTDLRQGLRYTVAREFARRAPALDPLNA